MCRRRYFFSHKGSAREKLVGKTADLHDEIGTFESEPNENVTESASPLKASSFRCDCNSRRCQCYKKVGENAGLYIFT